MVEQRAEYIRFMVYFKNVYPAIFEKYAKNISKPGADWKLISVNDNVDIKRPARMILTHIITEYYILNPE